MRKALYASAIFALTMWGADTAINIATYLYALSSDSDCSYCFLHVPSDVEMEGEIRLDSLFFLHVLFDVKQNSLGAGGPQYGL